MLQPILDRVLVRIVEPEQQSEIVTPDQFAQKQYGEVVAIGQNVVRGGEVHPLDRYVKVGDVVRIDEYSMERVDGNLYVTRLQDIRGIKQ